MSVDRSSLPSAGHQAQHGPPIEDLACSMRGAVAGLLPSPQVTCTLDAASLTHTPGSVRNPDFHAQAREIAAAVARRLIKASTPAHVSMHFSGVPASGSVHCRFTVDAVTAALDDLDSIVRELGGAMVQIRDSHTVTVALYPPPFAPPPIVRCASDARSTVRNRFPAVGPR